MNEKDISSKEEDLSVDSDAINASDNNNSQRPRHDALIRKALENPIVAKEFFEMHLPLKIKAMFLPHTLKIEKESFHI